MFCEKCHSEIDVNYSFCPKCGARIFRQNNDFEKDDITKGDLDKYEKSYVRYFIFVVVGITVFIAVFAFRYSKNHTMPKGKNNDYLVGCWGVANQSIPSYYYFEFDIDGIGYWGSAHYKNGEYISVDDSIKKFIDYSFNNGYGLEVEYSDGRVVYFSNRENYTLSIINKDTIEMTYDKDNGQTKYIWTRLPESLLTEEQKYDSE